MFRSSSWLNDTPLCRTAVNSLTGIEISPKLMVPLQIDLAIGVGRYLFRRLPNPGRARHPAFGGSYRSDDLCATPPRRCLTHPLSGHLRPVRSATVPLYADYGRPGPSTSAPCREKEQAW